MNRRTVARLARSEEPPRYRRAPTGSQLDLLEPVLRRLLEEWPQIKAPRLRELLRSDYGYTGSLRLVQARLQQLRPSTVRPAQRTGYRPGQVLQLDWAEMPTRPPLAGRERRVYALVASLPYSGAQTAFFSLDMTIESFLEGHVRAFEWLGGVPRECVYDNLRAVVARREGNEVVWNRRFLHLRGHYGFHATACTPAAPREKGSVEAGVRYLKSGFWPARHFSSLAELDGLYADWRDRVSNRRLHASGRFPVRGATRRRAAGAAAAAAGTLRLVGTPLDAGADRRLPAPRPLLLPGAGAVGARAGRAWLRPRPGLDRASRPGGRALPAQLRAGPLAAAADHASRAAGASAAGAAGADGRAARARRLRGALRMSPAKAKAGERLPYLLSKLKAPRVLERLEQTAALAREQAWPYERFLESLLEAEVFARDASDARMRVRTAAFRQ